MRPALVAFLVAATAGPAAADPVLATLIDESLAARPELREAAARARAEHHGSGAPRRCPRPP